LYFRESAEESPFAFGELAIQYRKVFYLLSHYLPKSVKSYLKEVPGLVALKSTFEKSSLNLVHTFPLFTPMSGGFYKDRAILTVQSINETFPFLSTLAASLGHRTEISSVENFALSQEDRETAAALKICLDSHGSDKANTHNYHLFYASILKNRDAVKAMLEIGLGTNNADVVSNVGSAEGKPGASLRAFRDYLPNAKIYGADIDRRILFQEERIWTFFVDQTDPASFVHLGQSLPAELDLIIDDGLHSPNANVATLTFALPKLKADGWFIVEDISESAVPLWKVVAALLPADYQPHILKCKGAIVFAVRRTN
jgi:hypothetical protein